jgi:hypothetical protein
VGSVTIPKLRRDNTKLFPLQGVQRDWCKVCTITCENLNLCKGLVQGVHRSGNRLSAEEALREVRKLEKEDARRARGDSLGEIFESDLPKIPEMQGVRGILKSSQRPSSGGITLSHKC